MYGRLILSLLASTALAGCQSPSPRPQPEPAPPRLAPEGPRAAPPSAPLDGLPPVSRDGARAVYAQAQGFVQRSDFAGLVALYPPELQPVIGVSFLATVLAQASVLYRDDADRAAPLRDFFARHELSDDDLDLVTRHFFTEEETLSPVKVEAARLVMNDIRDRTTFLRGLGDWSRRLDPKAHAYHCQLYATAPEAVSVQSGAETQVPLDAIRDRLARTRAALGEVSASTQTLIVTVGELRYLYLRRDGEVFLLDVIPS